MTITSEDIARVRRMVNEPTDATYSDVTISGYLVEYDEDKNYVAGEIWAEKASAIQSTMYNFSADGASYNLTDVFNNAVNQAKYYNSRRKVKSNLWVKDPEEVDSESVIINETDDEI